jgi:hypothetical protein
LARLVHVCGRCGHRASSALSSRGRALACHAAENFTLEELLDEDDVLQECKFNNRSLIEFLCKYETCEKLIRHVISASGEKKVRRCDLRGVNFAHREFRVC